MTLAQRVSAGSALARAEPVLTGGTVTALLTTVLALWHPGAGVTGILVPLVSLVVAALTRSRVSPGHAAPLFAAIGRLPPILPVPRYYWEDVHPVSTVPASRTTYHDRSTTLSFVDEIRRFIEDHAPTLEHIAGVAEQVANDPLTRAAASATALTAQMRQDFADLIAKADAEIARVVEEATQNGHAAGVQSTQPAEPAPEGEQPPA